MASSVKNMNVFKERYKWQTIGYDKLNMLRHIHFFKDMNGIMEHMKKHSEILQPRFQTVINKLNEQLIDTGIAQWTEPNGGYFVSVNVMNGTAKKVVQMCKEAGVVMTGAGATYPYGIDPDDSNIRIAPSYPPLDELSVAMDIFCVCAKIAAIDKLISQTNA